MINQKGQTWNESEVYLDPVTLKRVRKVTRVGLYNQTPTYHTGTGWTADGEFMVFASARNGSSALFRVHVPSGDITQLTESFDGVGCLDELHKSGGTSTGNGYGVTMLNCVAPHSRWAVYIQGRKLRAVHLETLEERVLIEDYGDPYIAGMPSIDPDEQYVLQPVMSAHPELRAGKPSTRGYIETFSKTGPEMHMLKVSLAGGEVTEVYSEKGIGCAHCPHNPVDGNLVLVDRDFPPRLWAGSDGVTNRIWTLNLATHQLTELPNQDTVKFQVHSVWTWDGSAVAYHGKSGLGGHYIGVVSKTGETIREYKFTKAENYGHISAMANRPAVILDGNLTTDMLLMLYYDRETPRIEMIARHGTVWGGLPWQYSHPHPQSDPTGRYISFNAVQGGRSDVYIVEV
jgi:oligogalacturonide lyase